VLLAGSANDAAVVEALVVGALVEAVVVGGPP
jgi:hypothetical protein